jgi:xanthine dehydrogenase large subunit
VINDIPQQWEINLFENPFNHNTILNSKAVGEPPFIHGLSVFFAIQNAISSINKDKIIELDLPATHEKIVIAIGTDG